MTVSEAIAEWLHEKKITHAFGIVGGGNHVLFNAISQAKKTEIVCCQHEQAAAMASGYFNRVAGRLASVCLVTTGAGSTNAITGVMAAWMDSIPLLVISGNEASKYMGAKTRVWGVQGFDSTAIPGVKRGIRAKSVDDIDAAYHIALHGRQGPVWVDICKDTQGQNA